MLATDACPPPRWMSRINRAQLARVRFANRLKAALLKNPYIASVRDNAKQTMETYINSVVDALNDYEKAANDAGLTFNKQHLGFQKKDDYKVEELTKLLNSATGKLETDVNAANSALNDFKTKQVTKKP